MLDSRYQRSLERSWRRTTLIGDGKVTNRLPLVSVSGFGHSGTTLLATIVGAHPAARLIPRETEWFLDPSAPTEVVMQALERDASNGDIRFVVEKTPRHVYVIPQIESQLPGTRFLVTVRHRCDVAASMLMRFQDWEMTLRRIRADLEGVRDVAHRDDVLVVRYEDLVEDLEGSVRMVCSHTGVAYVPTMLQWYVDPPYWFGATSTAETKGVGQAEHVQRRAWQIRQPLFDGRGRWHGELSGWQVQDMLGLVAMCPEEWGYTCAQGAWVTHQEHGEDLRFDAGGVP